MKIAVFGAGAIGGYLAVRLHQAGADVSVIGRGPHLAAMRDNGLTLKTAEDTATVKVRCSDKPEEIEEKMIGDLIAGDAGDRELVALKDAANKKDIRRMTSIMLGSPSFEQR